MSNNIQSAERVSQNDPSDNFVFRRSLLAYHHAAAMVSGDVLEIGTGSGYGISVIAPHARTFTTIDKQIPNHEVLAGCKNVEFINMSVPPLTGIDSCTFDYVIMFQVIEHIRDDVKMIDEMYRVLRPGGKLIISTPNSRMSLTRNPWHVGEYTSDEFGILLGNSFNTIEASGVFGNDKVMAYYNKNRLSVERITRFDVLDLQHRLPACVLQLPYDLLNRINRRRLLDKNTALTESITMDDYRVDAVADGCFDLLFIATK